MKVDLNKAREANFEVLPDGLYYLTITVRPGGFGDDDLLKRSKNGTLYMLEVELEVAEGEFTGARFVSGSSSNSSSTSHRQEQAERPQGGGESRSQEDRSNCRQRQGLDPKDLSEATEAQRSVDLKELNGLTFYGYVESKTYNERQNNFLRYVVTPDMLEWPNGAVAVATPPAIAVPPRNVIDDEIPFALAFFIVSTAAWFAAGGGSLIV